jgi:DNA-directed RNA polymerase specialized sigma24 family protein
MRSLEDTNTLETAHCLDISEEAVKVRLLRARRLLANASEEQVSNANGSAILPS